MKFILANWKANKTIKEVQNWLDTFLLGYRPHNLVTISICAPYPFLLYIKERILGLKNVYVGAQTLSAFEQGSYTGEVTARSLSEIVKFSLIGHSERRSTFHETNEDLAIKVKLAVKYGIEPVYCVRDEKDPIPHDVKYVAYEPVWAIGTGKNEKLEDVVNMKKKLSLPKNCVFIYGGSVNEQNVGQYLTSDEVGGFLPGKASWDAKQFLSLIQAASLDESK
ncbi:hypothetical protein A2334_02620 [Candidatus Roizmanbacteria bacterium RIFOXYB2_FULL_38_10]|uniref:Triosephosphate isomerase n=1 Tax=Candidatus Roizmanbacteria bacterium RIFOXYD1_FULL_38_12 TaxID=1802093 RepID=A0A1F7L058_9BACT|nr:MAG: hypothetical protein A3K47_01350 [Candidatus Roizmanbacteria bacterium RIFOXYA2_FULL_38_14]OGK63431.1 MAG: hypothetical protein A3K27_01350 [Candidatus Roizmanbacteria bacterium RIFOXYA1_FULL_37_12]OGK65277.1 MAG: hypothetical protein A3K38_01350 [Candidatus Roizmanbacteria bacterium RIFOXYB1_FULL_40_23]OGK68009.1 MAG: hypothetical protein A2334_02620 [Candidatus Roizmanbacteria bacterium RIFOXYB2_FULL_38_10]OGK69682.1 MAG: hypothetical protein A3K21_01355 [Candidatus Roizmanbacteria ba